jgi:hypothetical protein
VRGWESLEKIESEFYFSTECKVSCGIIEESARLQDARSNEQSWMENKDSLQETALAFKARTDIQVNYYMVKCREPVLLHGFYFALLEKA